MLSTHNLPFRDFQLSVGKLDLPALPTSLTHVAASTYAATHRENRHGFYPCVLAVASPASGASKNYARALRCLRCVGRKLHGVS